MSCNSTFGHKNLKQDGSIARMGKVWNFWQFYNFCHCKLCKTAWIQQLEMKRKDIIRPVVSNP